MKSTLEQFCRKLETTHESVQRLSKDFCTMLGVTLFAYVRVTDKGQVSWVTSNPEQDRFLLQSSSLAEDPVFDTSAALKEGQYLWFNDRKFDRCQSFYKERAKRYQVDHGMVLVRHKKGYLESGCFSGLLAKKPLYNIFTNQKELFLSFMDHVTKSLDRKIIDHLQESIPIGEMKSQYGKTHSPTVDGKELARLLGYDALLLLSWQEKRCLALLPEGYTYQAIGKKLHLSARTVEHYIESSKIKLGAQARSELCLYAEKLLAFGL